MADGPFGALARHLDRLESRGRMRTLSLAQGVDFSSNDYLGLARDPILSEAFGNAARRRVHNGSGGSRLLRGNCVEHESLEAKAASFFHAEAALFLGSGFSGNAALLSTLPQRGDLIVADELVHASAHVGMRQSKAKSVLASHNQAMAFNDAIAGWRSYGGRGTPWIVVESVYSMDGDVAPVADLMSIADRYEGILIIDEAHSTGIFGPNGRGLTAGIAGRENMIALHTCSKAMGVEGAIIVGPEIVKTYLINRAREFIYSTAPSPVIAEVVSAAIDRIGEADDLRLRLSALTDHANTVLCRPLDLPAPRSPIIPIIVHCDNRAVTIASALRRAGFDVRGIRPPTVPSGTSRLRVNLTLNATPADVDALASVLIDLLRQPRSVN